MFERPHDVTDEQVLALVRAAWEVEASEAVYVALGFGAHHWRVGDLFVTLDLLERRHTAATLETTYTAARDLDEAGLEFVLASLPTRHGTLTRPLGPSKALSATPWRDGASGDGSFTPEQMGRTIGWLDRLHDTEPPHGLRTWRPLVGPDLADELVVRTAHPWAEGPHGEAARTALLPHLGSIASWTAEYHRLAATSDPSTWVPTHGEPDTGNQLFTADDAFLVDWESLMVAPAERDLRTVVDAGHDHPRAEASMLTMFDLEWRLDEIAQYSAWFEGPHGDSADDRTALGGLRHELTRV